MNSDQYTADAICRSMGIPRFADPADLGDDVSAMRIVLRPSFTPEVCITIVAGNVHVATLHEMLWHQPMPCSLPGVQQNVQIPGGRQGSLVSSLHEAIHEIRHVERPVIICDGMSFDVVWRDGCVLDQLNTHVTGRHVVRFIRTLIQLTADAVDQELIRNNLAHCGKYVDLDLPVSKTEFPGPDRMNIGILGTQDDRDDLIRRNRTDSNS